MALPAPGTIEPLPLPMRILLVNKFYRRGGGDCVHFLEVEKLLRGAGHDVAVMTMSHPDNLPLPPGSYSLPGVRIDGTASQKFKAAARILGAGVDSIIGKALDEFRPGVVHLHNIHSYISPRIAQMAHGAGCKVVWTLHDYKLVCPTYSCLCNGNVCTDCMTDPLAVIKRRCMKNSLAASVLGYLEARRWSRGALLDCVDAFICPSDFMRGKMAEGGWPQSKLAVISNFANTDMFSDNGLQRCGACYIGRLSPEKGVELLAQAASRYSLPLTIMGTGPMESALRERYGRSPYITFAGAGTVEQVAALLARSAVSVIPSVWFENNPLSVIESLCCGTPVVGSRIGGIPELITPDNGLLSTPADVDSLGRAVRQALALPWHNAAISSAARQRFAPQGYYPRLMQLYTR